MEGSNGNSKSRSNGVQYSWRANKRTRVALRIAAAYVLARRQPVAVAPPRKQRFRRKFALAALHSAAALSRKPSRVSNGHFAAWRAAFNLPSHCGCGSQMRSPCVFVFVVLSLLVLSEGGALRNVLSTHPPLRCCFMDEPPITFQNNRSNWSNGLDGVIKEYLLQHQSYLNWSCSSMRPFRQQNGTDFNAFVSAMHKCTNRSTGQIIDSPHCNCDIGIGGWFKNPSRFGKVSYLPAFSYDRYVVFTHVSHATVSGKRWFFLQTFDACAWIGILGLTVMFIFLKMLDRRFEPDAQFTPLPPNTPMPRRYVHYLTKSRPLYRLRKATQSTLMRMVMLSDEPAMATNATTRQWVLNLVLAFASLFLILSYEASMTASLVQAKIQAKFQSAADLQNCHIEPSELCIIRGGAFETLWNVSIATGECHVNNPPHFMNSYKELYDAVQDGLCSYAIVIESAIKSAIRQTYCGRFVIVGEPILNGGLSMLLPIGSKLWDPMSRATLELNGNRSEPSLPKYLNTLPQCEMDMDTTLTFAKLRIFFAIVFAFGLIILLAMVLIPQHASAQSGGTRTRGALDGLLQGGSDGCGDGARGAVFRQQRSLHHVGIGSQCSRLAWPFWDSTSGNAHRWHSARLWDARTAQYAVARCGCCGQLLIKDAECDRACGHDGGG